MRRGEIFSAPCIWANSEFLEAPLFHQLFANQLQFPLMFRARLWVGQFERLECVENDLRNDQPRILFVVGGNDIPGRIARTGSTQAFFIGLHVLFPEFPLLDIREAELPVLVGLIDAFEESLALFLFRKMQEELDDPRAVAVEMVLHVHDGAIALLPDGFLIRQLIRNTLGLQNLRMHANDQHRSEEHTSELQSRQYLVCRLLLEKKKER